METLTASSRDDPIDVVHVGSEFLVFNKNAITLVEKYRIVGAYIGSLARCPSQNQILGLPLKLSTEEVLRLFEMATPDEVRFVDKNFGSSGQCFDAPNAEQIAKYETFREASYIEQVELFRTEKINNMNAHRDSIQQGTKKRQQRRENALMATVTKMVEAEKSQNAAVLASATNSSSVSESSGNLQQGTGATNDDAFEELLKKASKPIDRADSLFEVPFRTNSIFRRANEQSRSCVHVMAPRLSERDIDKFLVYRYFHERGYYLTHATKFGGDFLVYEKQPGTCHSLFIVHCVTRETRLPGRTLSSSSRLANAVHKTTIYCYVTRPSTPSRFVGAGSESAAWWHMVRQSNVECVAYSWRQLDPAKEKSTADASVPDCSASLGAFS